MQLSREARLVAGITLLTVPTILYGGVTLLGILTRGAAGFAPEGLSLNETQWALFRAGHAHAGVWVILSLVLQMLLDSAPDRFWNVGEKRVSQFVFIGRELDEPAIRALIPAASAMDRSDQLGWDNMMRSAAFVRSQ